MGAGGSRQLLDYEEAAAHPDVQGVLEDFGWVDGFSDQSFGFGRVIYLAASFQMPFAQKACKSGGHRALC